MRRTPEATAVVFEEQHLTYAELNARANQLAHRLRVEGLPSGERLEDDDADRYNALGDTANVAARLQACRHRVDVVEMRADGRQVQALVDPVPTGRRVPDAGDEHGQAEGDEAVLELAHLERGAHQNGDLVERVLPALPGDDAEVLASSVLRSSSGAARAVTRIVSARGSSPSGISAVTWALARGMPPGAFLPVLILAGIGTFVFYKLPGISSAPKASAYSARPPRSAATGGITVNLTAGTVSGPGVGNRESHRFIIARLCRNRDYGPRRRVLRGVVQQVVDSAVVDTTRPIA